MLHFDGSLEQVLSAACSRDTVLKSNNCFCLSCQVALPLRNALIVDGQVKCGLCRRNTVTGDAAGLPLGDSDFLLLVQGFFLDYDWT